MLFPQILQPFLDFRPKLSSRNDCPPRCHLKPDLSGTLSTEKPCHGISGGNTLGTVSLWKMLEETLPDHLLAGTPWELGWCCEWTSGCAEFPALLQVSVASLDKPSKVALSLDGSNKVVLFLKGKKKRKKKNGENKIGQLFLCSSSGKCKP